MIANGGTRLKDLGLVLCLFSKLKLIHIISSLTEIEIISRGDEQVAVSAKFNFLVNKEIWCPNVKFVFGVKIFFPYVNITENQFQDLENVVGFHTESHVET